MLHSWSGLDLFYVTLAVIVAFPSVLNSHCLCLLQVEIPFLKFKNICQNVHRLENLYWIQLS